MRRLLRVLSIARVTLVFVLLSTATGARAGTACQKVTVEGAVSAGQSWQTPIGRGWVFRVQPIAPPSYSGWDLVVDRQPGAGYPDALLLGTPPYNSMNEREIGTTYGLRAQDALGWNPRDFRFFTDPAAFLQAQKVLPDLVRLMPSGGAKPGAEYLAAFRRMLELEKHSAAGEFHILDAHLTPGVADPAPYAENWARDFARTSYTMQSAPGGKSSPLGTLNWIRFSVTLWLPPGWKVPDSLHSTAAVCAP